MNPQELLDALTDLFPRFRGQWDDLENNMHRDDGQFTPHGVCAEFSSYFLEHCASATDETLRRLFAFIEGEVASDPEDRDAVANALCTCFLENIALTQAGDRCVRFMGPASTDFFEHWHGAR
jgi:hypothetical protein